MVNDKRGTTGLPRQMQFQSKMSTSVKESATLFADYFESVYSQSSDQSQDIPHEPAYEGANDVNFTLGQVRDTLRTLDPYKSMGPDGIPNSLLHSLSGDICLPLWLIYSNSLDSGTFLDL